MNIWKTHPIFALATMIVASILMVSCAPAATSPANELPVYKTATPRPATVQPAPLSVDTSLTMSDGTHYAQITYKEGETWKCVTGSQSECIYSSSNGNLTFTWAENPIGTVTIAHTTAKAGQLQLAEGWFTTEVPLFVSLPKLAVGASVIVTDGSRFAKLTLTDNSTGNGSWNCVVNGTYCYSTPKPYVAFATFVWQNGEEKVEFAYTGEHAGELKLMPGWYVNTNLALTP